MKLRSFRSTTRAVLGGTFCLYSLLAFPQPDQSESAFRRRVLDIESFMHRFNLEEDGEGNWLPPLAGADLNTYWIQERSAQITQLFNEASLRNEPGLKAKLPLFLRAVNTVDRQVKLNFYDSNWYAKVILLATYQGQPQQVELILQLEQTEPKVSQWVIRAFQADFLPISSNPHVPGVVTARDSIHFIPPNSHGTDFMDLPRYLIQPGAAKHFLARDINPAVATRFISALASGQLIPKEVSQVQFHLLQISDWILQVDEYNRATGNTGWLVTNLIQADSTAKKSYAVQYLHLF